jgi:hypothetical protein
MKEFKVPATGASVRPPETSSTAATARGGPSEVICVRRVIEYTGTRHWVEETLRQSVTSKTGTHRCAFGTIKQIALLEFQMRSGDRPNYGGGTRRGKKN